MPAQTDLRRQTFVAKEGDVSSKWRHVDASGIPLGRLAAEVALVLMGKHRPEYTPNVITGDRVIVLNASKVQLTGRKAEQSVRMRYTRYPGGLKIHTFGQVKEEKPDMLIRDAVKRMLPKNRLSRVMLKNLEIFAGAEHPFGNHKPTELKVSR
jgi:large subunit ribosomal protein L13